MCGIAGIVGQNSSEQNIKKMLFAQQHRGPDFTGFISIENEVALGHNRLSIIDLSNEANQPFISDCKDYVLVFNGEIYNYLELKKELSHKYVFKTKSDTEVLLNAYKEFGKDCLHKLNGMFAFAIWQKSERKLFAARDRFGVKPFHYFHKANDFYFASEIKPFWELDIQKEKNESVWLKYFCEGSYGLPDETFWNNIHQLPAGHFLEYKNEKLTVNKWYNFEERIFEKQQITHNNEEQFITDLLMNSINFRFRADVPVGFNLSGGLDSSTLLALIDKQDVDKKSIEAFTFITNDDRYDEIYWVKSMLQNRPFHLNVCELNSNAIPELSQTITDLQQEPFGGIPTLAYSKIFKRAREKGVIVLLDGQGSDEAWAGYDYYLSNSEKVIQGTNTSPFRKDVLDRDFLLNYTKTHYAKPFQDDLLNTQYRDLFYTKIPRALRFNDRISMLYGTELREPFLDFELVEYVFSRSKEFKIKDGTQKWLLRKIANNFLHQEVALAPKRPLQTPQREWLTNDLKNWVRAEVESISDVNWFNKKFLLSELDNFFKGDNSSSFHIWQWISLAQILKSK
ncbi:MAG TPA: asparagine synthase (glutamine-hydrolyzing) [Flavobacterium lutivivi]|nr:asparagine synthase (glutamine-hydrolyzing) [Flavobacterium lutivivi]